MVIDAGGWRFRGWVSVVWDVRFPHEVFHPRTLVIVAAVSLV